MSGRIRTIFTVASLILALALAALWTRSWWRYDRINTRIDDRRLSFHSICGRIMIGYTSQMRVEGGTGWRTRDISAISPADVAEVHRDEWLGIRYKHNTFLADTDPQPVHIHSLSLPFWLPLALTLLLPALHLRSTHHRRPAFRANAADVASEVVAAGNTISGSKPVSSV